MKKFQSLQIFRGLAALTVLFFHIDTVIREKFAYPNSLAIFKQGVSGVDFFFVLSGFIIMYAHYRDFGQKGKVLSYFWKRFQRIYPIYWIISLGVVAVYILMGKNVIHSFGINPAFIIKSVTLWQQWPLIIPTAWTLSYEVYFYLIFGLCLIFLTPNLTMIAAAAYALIVAALNYLGTAPNQVIPLDFYILEFVFGVFSAWLVINRPLPKLRTSALLFTLSCILVIVVWTIYSIYDFSGAMVIKYRALSYGIPFALLVTSSVWLDKNLRLKPVFFFSRLGDASYVLYLIHPAVILFSAVMLKNHVTVTKDTVGFVIALFTLVGISASFIVHFAVEKPLLRLLRRLKQPGVVKRHLVEAVN